MQFSAAGLSQSTTQSSGRFLNPRVTPVCYQGMEDRNLLGGAGVKGFGSVHPDL